MASVRHKILVLSGKGGVGKSTFAAHLAHGLASDESRQVGVLDIDICGPSMPKVMGLEGEQVHMSGSGWSPVVSVRTSNHLLECRWFHVSTLIRAPPLGGRSTSCTKVFCVMHQSGTNLT